METAEAVLIAGLFGKILLLLFAQMETEKSQEIVKKGEAKGMAANRLTGQRTLSIGQCCKVRGTETVDLNQRQSMPRQSRNSDKVANLCRRGVEVGSVVVFYSDVNGKERM